MTGSPHLPRRFRCRRLPALVAVSILGSLILPTSVGSPRPVGSAAQAPTAPFTVTAVGAFGGTFKVGEWFPVLVTIENGGPDTHVEVRATVGPSDGATTFIAPVELPAGTTKLVTLYTLPEALPRAFDVLVVERDGEAAASAEVKINPLFPTDTLCGAGGYQSGALAALGRVQPAGAGGQGGMGGPVAPVTVAPVDLATVPTAPEGLYSFDCLVIGGGDALATLGPDQQAALTTWVHHGGQLIVAGGEGWQAAAASIPPDLLPVVVDGSQTIEDLSGLAELAGSAPPRGPVVVATARPRDDVTGVGVVAAAGDLPLVVERPIGSGLVTYLAFDPAAPPFAAWDAAEGLWQGLLRRLGSAAAFMGMPPDVNPRRMETAPLVGALSQIPALDLPSMRLLIALLGAYVVAVSPLNYLVLRRLGKLRWSWATTLILVGVFAAAAYGLGARIRGNDVIVNRIEILQTDGTAGGPAFARSYVGLFSPSKASYQVRVGDADDAVLLSSMPASVDPWAPSAGGGGGTVVQGQPAVVRDLGVGQWASRFFMTEHQPADGPRVEADLRFEGERLVGTITNPSAGALDDCAIFIGFQVFILGELAAGETREVSFELGAAAASVVNPSGMPLSMLLLGANPRGPWPDTGNDRELRVKQTVLDAFFGYSFGGPVLPAGVNFVGWAAQGTTPIAVAGRTVAAIDNVMLHARLPVSFGGPMVSVPPGIAVFGLYRSDAESAFVSATEVQVYNGSAEFEAALAPEARPDRVTGLTLHLPNPGMMGPPPEEIAVYDWQAAAYVVVEPRGGTLELEDPGRFFDPQRGLIRVRLTAGINTPVWTTLAVSLQGERDA